MRRRTTRRLFLGELLGILVVVALLAAWLGPGLVDRLRGEREVAADAPLGDQCPDVPESATRLTLTGADGRDLGGASVGAPGATTAVVLRHGASQTLCDWLGWADGVAADTGARVLVASSMGTQSTWTALDRVDDVCAVVAIARGLLDLAREAGVTSHDLPVDTDDHSLALVERHDEVATFVTDAVASCT